MIRILQVYPQLNNAGTEMVIMNLYHNINREEIQFDFLVQRPGELDDHIREMGGKIFYIDKIGNYKKKVFAFFKGHQEYRVVHTHTHREMGVILKMAKKADIPYRIAHSHNFRGDLPGIVKYYKVFSSWAIEQNATNFLACSTEAAEWLYPRKNQQAVIWNNAIDINAFIFNETTRREYRNQLGIPDSAKVICHVGRFAEQKNHVRIIGILNELMEEHEDIYGILVGTGPLLNKIKAMAKCNRVIFLGNRKDVPKILCAADLFLFPSLYEGLGIVAVEAQASGIKCIASVNVPSSADIGIGTFEQVKLKESNEIWKKRILKGFEEYSLQKRIELSQKALDSKYNISAIAENVERFYLNMK